MLLILVFTPLFVEWNENVYTYGRFSSNNSLMWDEFTQKCAAKYFEDKLSSIISFSFSLFHLKSQRSIEKYIFFFTHEHIWTHEEYMQRTFWPLLHCMRRRTFYLRSAVAHLWSSSTVLKCSIVKEVSFPYVRCVSVCVREISTVWFSETVE